MDELHDLGLEVKHGKMVDATLVTAHALVDSNGIVEGLSVTPANVHNTVMFPALLDKSPLSDGDTVCADKGYHSEKNKELLKQRKLNDQIMHKRKRNEPENRQAIERNKRIAKRRYVVERTFGSLKQSYGWGRTRYIGLLKTTFYLQIRCLAFNINWIR